MSADSVRVKVGEGWAVHDGKQQRGAGETVEVDADTTDQWSGSNPPPVSGPRNRRAPGVNVTLSLRVVPERQHRRSASALLPPFARLEPTCAGHGSPVQLLPRPPWRLWKGSRMSTSMDIKTSAPADVRRQATAATTPLAAGPRHALTSKASSMS
jgi:hypothetical protein